MSEGFKQFAAVEKEVVANKTGFAILDAQYETYKNAMSDYERNIVVGELERRSGSPIDTYAYLRGLAKPNERIQGQEVTEAYKHFINSAAERIKEEVELDIGIYERLLDPLDT